MSTDHRYRWGIVGPGRIAAQFADGMRLVDGGEIGAVASRSAERAKAFGDRFGIRSCYGDSADLAADPDVEIVYVATPHARHAADTVTFLEVANDRCAAAVLHPRKATCPRSRVNSIVRRFLFSWTRSHEGFVRNFV